MKLREAIYNIPDDDWIEITEQTRDKYRNYIGKAPKKVIKGEVLEYDVLYSNCQKFMSDYIMHSFVVSNTPLITKI